MAPPRKRLTPFGEHLRALRNALRVDQKGLGQLMYVSDRTISRWENGRWPTEDQAERLLDHAKRVSGDLHDAMALALGYELEDPDEPEPPIPPTVTTPPPPPPLSPQVVASPLIPQAPSEAALRAALDAVLYAACEERDMLPRHARALAVDLLQAVDKLGVAPRRAAEIVGASTKKPAGSEG